MGKDVEKDPRNELYKSIMYGLSKNIVPKWLYLRTYCTLFLIIAKRGEQFTDLKRLVNEFGYGMDCKVQIALRHGVFQNRQRVIIVGWKRTESRKYSYPDIPVEEMPYKVLPDLFADLLDRKAGEGQLCEPIRYVKPLAEMPYLSESEIRGILNFTTQHVARPTNDRKIYKMVVDMRLNKRQRLNYAKLPSEMQNTRIRKYFLTNSALLIQTRVVIQL